MKHILLVEDDAGIADSLKLYLESSNFSVTIEGDGANALAKIEELTPDIIILDLNLPHKDGITITREYREYGQTPIIMLTARSSEMDRVRGLEIGADDYISKPFSPRELLARINTILRRTQKPTSKALSFKNIKIDTAKRICYLDKKELSLTANEYDILVSLVEKNGDILTREEIMKDIMGYENYLYDRTVDTHIKNLRKKLDPHEYILTVRGSGYRLDT